MKTTLERQDRTSACLAQRTGQAWGAQVIRNSEADRWARICAAGGASVWAGLAVLARIGVARIGAIELMFLFAPLVIVPLGIELGRVMGAGSRVMGIVQRIQPIGAGSAVASMLLPPGRMAGLMSLGWMMVCMLTAGDGLIDLVRLRQVAADRGVRATLALARIDLAVGGAWLLASRLGMRPMGIQEPIGLLTAVHFHFAGFAAATIAAATLAFAERHRPQRLRLIILLVVVLPYLVALGFVISPVLKMTAAVLFSASVAGLAVFLRSIVKQIGNATARTLLQIAAGAVFAGMLFAVAYAVANFLRSGALTIPQMARTHGILNAIGFCLPGLLGWLIEHHSCTTA